MIVFPALDIRDGKYVRLQKGDFNKETVFGEDPLQMAKTLEDKGAKFLHIIDLDGAKGEGKENSDLICEIVRNLSVPVQTGGGIRDFERIEKMLTEGIARVILGTAAFEDPSFLDEACRRFPGSIAVSIDVKDGFIATHGWQKVSSIKDEDFIKQITEWGVVAVIYTDISRDGMLKGINLEAILRIKAISSVPVIASGGITSINDLDALKQHNVYGAIIGKALYTGAIPLEALSDFF